MAVQQVAELVINCCKLNTESMACLLLDGKNRSIINTVILCFKLVHVIGFCHLLCHNSHADSNNQFMFAYSQ